MATSETKSSVSSLSSVIGSTLPIYVTAKPKQLTFHGDSKTSSVLLHIMNVSCLRVAFRIRTNEPTRYIVMPATGFLSANEGVNILITSLNMRRYRRRHRFIIQAMKAEENDKDRRKIWNDSRAGNLDLVQCIRICTLKASKQRSDESKSEEELDQLTMSSNSETGESESSSLQVQIMTDEEKSTKINELNIQINNKLEEKRNEWQSLMQAINEVKKIEVDLDRATVQCNDLNKMIILRKDQQKTIKAKLAKIDAILDTLKNEIK
ncbi:MSP (Major sperm protein) domain family protein [Acanthocheilonema viteae]